MIKTDIVLVANSPGELSALVKPVAETISDRLKDTRIILVLTPCQYTSGKEVEYVKTIRGITEIVTATGYKNWILRNFRPSIDFNKKGAVLYLGGDLAHAVLVAKKLKFPAFAYVQDRVGWTGFYHTFFIPDDKAQAKFPRLKKTKIVGNLMVDSVSHIPKWSPQRNVITFLPGSRNWQIKHTTPIYKKIIDQLQEQMPQLTFQIVSSPFQKASGIDHAKLIPFEKVSNSDLIITIPGTNTARLAALGIPMIVIFPLDNPQVIPMEGLIHYFGKIPYLGSMFKRYLANTLNRQTKFFALPNIKAGREIVPEIRGTIDPAEVAQLAILLLKDDNMRSIMSAELVKSMGKPGAAIKIMEEIDAALQKIV